MHGCLAVCLPTRIQPSQSLQQGPAGPLLFLVLPSSCWPEKVISEILGESGLGSRSSNEPACGAVFQCRNKQCNHTEHSVVLSEALSGLRSGRGWEGQKGLLVNHRMGVCICAHMRVCACAHMRVCACAHMSLFTNPSHSLESGSNEHQGQLRNQKSGTMWATLERGAGLNRTGNTPWAH